MELSSLSREGYNSRANKTVMIFAWVYLGICAAAFLCYWAAGMSPFDAINHAFSVCATGGFSPKTLSIGAYDSVVIDLVTIFFMFIASCHFGLIFLAIVGRSLRPLDNPVLKYYFFGLLSASVVCGISLRMSGMPLGESFLQGTFHVVSYASTTGFAIGDNSTWPMLPCFILMVVSLVCGCAGSTTGGMKVDRAVVLFKAIRRQIDRVLHPSSVVEIRLGRAVLKDDDVYPHILYIALFLLLLCTSIVTALLIGDPNGHAITGSISCLGTVGPSLGTIGSMGNYNAEPAALKVLFSLDMFLGRVEIYPVFAVLSMIIHPKRK